MLTFSPRHTHVSFLEGRTGGGRVCVCVCGVVVVGGGGVRLEGPGEEWSGVEWVQHGTGLDCAESMKIRREEWRGFSVGQG